MVKERGSPGGGTFSGPLALALFCLLLCFLTALERHSSASLVSCFHNALPLLNPKARSGWLWAEASEILSPESG